MSGLLKGDTNGGLIIVLSFSVRVELQKDIFSILGRGSIGDQWT